MARGADPVHAAGAIGTVSALPTEAEWGEDELESDHDRDAFPLGTVGGAAGRLDSRQS